MAAIRLQDIRKSFGATPVLRGVSLDIADGEFLSLLGPSGCGKSTLLRIIAGLEFQDSGDVELDGRAIDALRASARNLAMVFQSYALYGHLSVAENMLVPLKMRDLSAWERLPLLGPLVPGRRARVLAMRARVTAVAETLRITGLLDRKPGQLSGGQRQRVALGRAMVREPAAFLMDEPLSNLDAALRVHMRTEIADLHRSLDATFVYVTHDQVEAMTMSSRIAVMLDGEIIQVGTPTEIYDDPKDLRVAEFIGSPRINVVPAIADLAGRPVFNGIVLGDAFEARAGDSVTLGIRPEHLRLASPGRGLFVGRLRHKENLGAEFLLHVAVPGIDTPMIVRVEPNQARGLAPGFELDLAFAAEDLRAFDDAGCRLAPRAALARSKAYG